MKIRIPCEWTQDFGYVCPRCRMFVCVPESEYLVGCPSCPAVSLLDALEVLMERVLLNPQTIEAVRTNIEPLITAIDEAMEKLSK